MNIIEISWNKPVTACLQNGLQHTFRSVEDALDFLENEWPTKSGTHHRRALDMCRAAHARLISREVARETFISACIEACMPLVLQPARSKVPAASIAALKPSQIAAGVGA